MLRVLDKLPCLEWQLAAYLGLWAIAGVLVFAVCWYVYDRLKRVL